MSGAASRSQFSRFAKRRLMLLMLKLAIFIGSGRSERIEFNGRIAPSVVHPNQNLMRTESHERPAALRAKERAGRFRNGCREPLLIVSDPMPVPSPTYIRMGKAVVSRLLIPDRPAL